MLQDHEFQQDHSKHEKQFNMPDGHQGMENMLLLLNFSAFIIYMLALI